MSTTRHHLGHLRRGAVAARLLVLLVTLLLGAGGLALEVLGAGASFPAVLYQVRWTVRYTGSKDTVSVILS
jgi:hypothetical protein